MNTEISPAPKTLAPPQDEPSPLGDDTLGVGKPSAQTRPLRRRLTADS